MVTTIETQDRSCMSLLNSPQNSTGYIQTEGFSPCTLFPDLLPPNPLADLLTIYLHVTIKTTLSPQYQHKVMRFKNCNFFIVNFSISSQNNLVRSRIWIVQRLVDPDYINADRKHFTNSVQICLFMNHKKCRPYK